jgi:tripartite-type tricarboxylate transporter receptor subunit TctC
MGQPFPVENRTGAGGLIGFAEAARAAPDGSTLLVLDSSITMIPHTTDRMPFDAERAFAPIVLIASAPFMLLVNASSRFQNFAQFIAAARKAPEALSFGTGGPGSSPHFTFELLQQVAGVKKLHVPFRGGSLAMQAVVAGQVDCSFTSISAAGPQVSGGRLRALAIAASERTPLMPDVPTFAEVGLPGVVGGVWVSFAMPAGTPAAILDRVEAATQAALQDEGIRQRLREQGLKPEGAGQREVARMLRDDTERWGRVAAAAGIARQ